MDKVEELKKNWVDDFLIGSIWVNSNDYKVKILDYGLNEVWVLYLENQNKTGWDIGKFLQEYKPSFS